MKTAISLPDALFNAADAYAARTRLSRSELYARALAEFLARNDDDQIAARLNAVCAGLSADLEPDVAAAGRRLLLECEC